MNASSSNASSSYVLEVNLWKKYLHVIVTKSSVATAVGTAETSIQNATTAILNPQTPPHNNKGMLVSLVNLPQMLWQYFLSILDSEKRILVDGGFLSSSSSSSAAAARWVLLTVLLCTAVLSVFVFINHLTATVARLDHQLRLARQETATAHQQRKQALADQSQAELALVANKFDAERNGSAAVTMLHKDKEALVVATAQHAAQLRTISAEHELQRAALTRRLEDTNEALEAAREESTSFRDQLDSAVRESESRQSQLDRALSELAGLSALHQQELADSRAECELSLAAAARQVQELKVRNSSLKEELYSAQVSLETASEQLEQSNREARSLKTALSDAKGVKTAWIELSDKLQELETEHRATVDRLQSTQRKSEQTASQLEAALAESRDLQQHLTTAQAALSDARHECREFQLEASASKRSVTQTAAALRECETAFASHREAAMVRASDAEMALAKQTSVARSLLAEVESLKTDRAHWESLLVAATKDSSDQSAKSVEALHEASRKWKEQLKTIEAQHKVEVDSWQAEMTRVRALWESSEERLAAADNLSGTLQSELRRVKASSEATAARLTEAVSIEESARQELNRTQAQLRVSDEHSKTLETRLSDALTLANDVQSGLHRTKLSLMDTEEKLRTSEQSVEASRKELREVQQEAKKQSDRLQRELIDLRKQLEDSHKAYSEVNEALRNLLLSHNFNSTDGYTALNAGDANSICHSDSALEVIKQLEQTLYEWKALHTSQWTLKVATLQSTVDDTEDKLQISERSLEVSQSELQQSQQEVVDLRKQLGDSHAATTEAKAALVSLLSSHRNNETDIGSSNGVSSENTLEVIKQLEQTLFDWKAHLTSHWALNAAASKSSVDAAEEKLRISEKSLEASRKDLQQTQQEVIDLHKQLDGFKSATSEAKAALKSLLSSHRSENETTVGKSESSNSRSSDNALGIIKQLEQTLSDWKAHQSSHWTLHAATLQSAADATKAQLQLELTAALAQASVLSERVALLEAEAIRTASEHQRAVETFEEHEAAQTALLQSERRDAAATAQSLETALSALRAESDTLRAERVWYEEELRTLQGEAQELRKDQTRLLLQLQSDQGEMIGAREEILRLQADNGKLQQEIEVVNSHLTSAGEVIRGFETEVKGLQNAIAKHNNVQVARNATGTSAVSTGNAGSSPNRSQPPVAVMRSPVRSPSRFIK